MKFSDLTAYADGKILAGILDNTGYLVINNPERHNAVSLVMYEAAAEIVEAMADDDEARLLVICGQAARPLHQGQIFKIDPTLKRRTGGYLFCCLHGFIMPWLPSKPTIAMITGYCIGGGMGLATCCDIRICEDKSRFAAPAARLGLGYAWTVAIICAAAHLWSRKFSLPPASSQLRKFDMGYHRVAPAYMLDAYIADYITRIAENAPMTMASIKAITQDLQKPESGRDRARIDALVKACFDSEDYIEGRRAFMEKRKPRFTGK